MTDNPAIEALKELHKQDTEIKRLRDVNAEMLEALRKFDYEMGQYYDYDTGTGNNLPGGIMEAWTGARVAIAKAEPSE